MKKIEIKNSGVYSISSPDGKLLYIGASSNIENRFMSHYSSLNNKTHSNRALLSSCEYYGFDNLEFKIIFCCDEKDIFYYEKFFINVMNPLCNIINNKSINGQFKFVKTRKPKIKDDDDYLAITNYIKQVGLFNKVKTKEISSSIFDKTNMVISSKKIGIVLNSMGYKSYQDAKGGRWFIKK